MKYKIKLIFLFILIILSNQVYSYKIITDNEQENIFLNCVCNKLNLSVKNCTKLMDYVHNDTMQNNTFFINRSTIHNYTYVENITYYKTILQNKTIYINHTIIQDLTDQTKLDHEYRMEKLKYEDENKTDVFHNYYTKQEIDLKISEFLSNSNPPTTSIKNQNTKMYDYFLIGVVVLVLIVFSQRRKIKNYLRKNDIQKKPHYQSESNQRNERFSHQIMAKPNKVTP